MRGSRIYQRDVARLREILSPRDLAVLDQVRDLRLMSGAQIAAVHFPPTDHESADAAARASRRVLHRLIRDGLLVRLDRRVGGIRGGSSAFIYAASEVGYRVLDGDGPRRRFKEPSATFVRHTLAITQLVVDLIERQRSKTIEILRLETEPRCWRSFTAAASREIVRPDLFVAVGVGDFEHHWFVEMDLGTETMHRRLTKCKQYEQYYRSGNEQAEHDLFPRVLWIVPNQRLANGLFHDITRSRGLTDGVFAVATPDRALTVLAGEAA
jgi:hypothetical protein